MHSANSFAIAFSEDLLLFTGLSATEDVFELWEAKTLFLWCPIFDDEDARDPFQRTDSKLMRTAAFSKNSGIH